MKKVFAIFLLVIVTGCGGRPGGISDALKYDAKSLARVQMPDDNYRVFEHPNRDRLMTTTSYSAAAGQGIVKGLTLGIATPETPEGRHEAAARRYMDLTSRSACTIKSGYELVKTQYEFMIDCPPGTLATKIPSVEEQASIPFTPR